MSEEQQESGSGLPAEAVAAIDAINTEREEELRMQNPSALEDEGDEVSSPEVSESADEPSGTEPEQPEIDEALSSRAKAFGLDPKKYSAADLQSRLDDFDRMFSSKGQQQLQSMMQQRQQPPQQQYRPPQQQQVPPQQQPQTPQQQQQQRFFELEEDYGELRDKLESGAAKMQHQLLGVMNVMASQMMQQDQVIRQWQQQQSQQAAERQATEFHDAVQELGDTVFGKKQFSQLKPDSAEAKALGTLGDQVRYMALGLQAAGLPLPPMKELVTRAYRVAFHDRIENQLREQQNERLKAASRTRMGGGRRVAAPHGYQPPTGPDPAKDPVLLEAWGQWSS